MLDYQRWTTCCGLFTGFKAPHGAMQKASFVSQNFALHSMQNSKGHDTFGIGGGGGQTWHEKVSFNFILSIWGDTRLQRFFPPPFASFVIAGAGKRRRLSAKILPIFPTMNFTSIHDLWTKDTDQWCLGDMWNFEFHDLRHMAEEKSWQLAGSLYLSFLRDFAEVLLRPSSFCW